MKSYGSMVPKGTLTTLEDISHSGAAYLVRPYLEASGVRWTEYDRVYEDMWKNKDVNFVLQKFLRLRLKETSVTDNHWSVRIK